MSQEEIFVWLMYQWLAPDNYDDASRDALLALGAFASTIWHKNNDIIPPFGAWVSRTYPALKPDMSAQKSLQDSIPDSFKSTTDRHEDFHIEELETGI